jgi:hypothetical protein
MADDVAVYDNGTCDSTKVSEYARITADHSIQVRGTFGVDWPAYNQFTPTEARRLAKYINELADDAERNPEAEELEKALWAAGLETPLGFSMGELAKRLVAKGYHK